MIAEATSKVVLIETSKIKNDPEFNCRGQIAPIDVVDLARSIAAHGLQQPITVQPYKDVDDPEIEYRIVSGHRRYVAKAIVNKDKTIEAIIRTDLDEQTALILNLEENLQRKDLNMLQEANALKRFKRFGMGRDEVAREIGMSSGWVQVRYMILDFPPEIQQECAAGTLTQTQIRELASLPRSKQYEAVKRVKEAKESGQRSMILPPRKKPKNPFAKRERKRDEIFEMQEEIQKAVGNNFGTRCLAWTAGEISDLDLYRDLREFAHKQGIPYEIPKKLTET